MSNQDILSNPKKLRRLSRKHAIMADGPVCYPCKQRLKRKKMATLSGDISLLGSQIRSLESGVVPENIREIFESVAVSKSALECSIKHQLKQLEQLTSALNTFNGAYLLARRIYSDWLWNSYPERRKRANYAISAQELRVMVFGRDDFKCKKCKSSKHLSVDHITPVVSGGSNDLDNLQTLCRKCNSSKGGKLQPT